MNRPWFQRDYAALLAIVLLGLSLRCCLAADKSTFIDEVYHISWAKGYDLDTYTGVRAIDLGVRRSPLSVADAFRMVHRMNPPLNDVLLNLWMRSFGSDQDFVLRLMYIVFGSLTVLVAFLLGVELEDRKTGLVLAGLVALSPLHVYYAQEINHYAPATFLLAVSYLFLFRWLRTGRLVDGAVLTVAAALACYGHYYACLAIFSQFIGVLIAERRQPRHAAKQVLPLVAAAFLVAADARAMICQLRFATPSAFSGEFGGLRYFGRRTLANVLYCWLGTAAERLSLASASLVVLVAGVLFFLGILRLRSGRQRAVVGAGVLAPLVLTSVAYFILRKNQVLWPRYYIFYSLMVFAAVAVLLAKVARRRLAQALSAGLLLTMLWGLRDWYAKYEKRPWREVAATLDRLASPDEPILVFLPNLVYALGRYLRTNNVMFGISDRPSLEQSFASAAAAAPSAWLLTAWADGNPAVPKLRSRLACSYGRHYDYSFFGIELTHYRTATGPLPEACGVRSGFEQSVYDCVYESGVTTRVRGWLASPDSLRAAHLADEEGHVFGASLLGRDVAAVPNPSDVAGSDSRQPSRYGEPPDAAQA